MPTHKAWAQAVEIKNPTEHTVVLGMRIKGRKDEILKSGDIAAEGNDIWVLACPSFSRARAQAIEAKAEAVAKGQEPPYVKAAFLMLPIHDESQYVAVSADKKVHPAPEQKAAPAFA